MPDQFLEIFQQAARQVGHWTEAASRLSRLDELASPQSWKGLEHYLNTSLKSSLQGALNRLQRDAKLLQRQLYASQTLQQLVQVQRQVDNFRKKYLKTETMLDFYADAINTRTNDDMASLMRACDRIAYQSMKYILEPLGKTTPPVLTYIDKGLGASILKAGLRLWDGHTESPAAAIKIVRHNLYRPTALIHEAGHQVAHILDWNDELAETLRHGIKDPELSEMWSGWASEIAADTFAFVHTGYASIAGLHDVVSGDEKWVFRNRPFDPHPISYLRVMLGTSMCRSCFGKGPWDQMDRVWVRKYVLDRAAPDVISMIKKSVPLLTDIARLCLNTPLQAFGGKSIAALIVPARVHPYALKRLMGEVGPALFTSHHWVSNEAVRLLALSGYQMATVTHNSAGLFEKQRQWMLRLGGTLLAA